MDPRLPLSARPRHRPRAVLASSLALCASLLAAGATPAPAAKSPATFRAELAELPPVALDRFEPQGREQMERQRAVVEELLASGETDQEQVARAFGALGSLYLLYDLLDAAEAALENARALHPDERAWHYYLGVVHFREGRPEEAEESLERALELGPDDPATLIRLGRLALDGGRLDEAERRFDAVLEVDPESAAALAGLGRIAYERGAPERAVERFDRALELQPEATSLHHQLGLAYRALDDLERARTHLELNRHDPVSFPDPMMAGLTSLLGGSSIHIHRGSAAMAKGDLDRALSEYHAAVEADPESPKAHYNLGAVMLEKGDPARARAHLERAVELDPDYRDAHVNLAGMFAEAGEWRRAAEHYGEATRIDPLDYAARVGRAVALAREGRKELAAEELRGLLAEAPESLPEVRARAHLELAALAEEAEDPAAAARHYRATVELDPARLPGHLGLARSLARSGELAAATDAYERAIALDPSDLDARFGRAMALLLGGDPARARAALEEDLESLPEAVPLTHLLARLLATAPDPSVRDGVRAVELARKVFQKAPGMDHAETLAMAHAEAGDFQRAVEWQGRVLERARTQGAPAQVLESLRRRLERYRRGEPERSPWEGP